MSLLTVKFPSALDALTDGRTFSLSLRERAGVRGKLVLAVSAAVPNWPAYSRPSDRMAKRRDS